MEINSKKYVTQKNLSAMKLTVIGTRMCSQELSIRDSILWNLEACAIDLEPINCQLPYRKSLARIISNMFYAQRFRPRRRKPKTMCNHAKWNLRKKILSDLGGFLFGWETNDHQYPAKTVVSYLACLVNQYLFKKYWPLQSWIRHSFMSK